MNKSVCACLFGYDLNIMFSIDFALGCQRQSILADLIPEL